ncbi:MAG: hypothetical protein ABI036_13990 [Fibrobacteria bacterium]
MVTQLIISKTKSEIPRPEIIQLTKLMVEFFKQQSGFIKYELFENGSSWADKILWESQDQALQGISAFKLSDIGRKMLSILEPGLVVFTGTLVQLD